MNKHTVRTLKKITRAAWIEMYPVLIVCGVLAVFLCVLFAMVLMFGGSVVIS